MTPFPPSPTFRFLDPAELATLLGISERAVILRAKRRPWLLPPRASLFDKRMLRWRQDVVWMWLGEQGLEVPSSLEPQQPP
jgi:hypothetical protein